jgi:hypothetical protein
MVMTISSSYSSSPWPWAGKAETLAALSSWQLPADAQIAPLVYFSVSRWSNDNNQCINDIVSLDLSIDQWIVRSSCLCEDQLGYSGAGAFLSLLNVATSDLSDAIDQVIDSYGELSKELADSYQILVQPMLRNVRYAGVAFSHDPSTGALYRRINWSDQGDTDAITSGRAAGKMWQIAACAVNHISAESVQDNPWLLSVIKLLDGLCCALPQVALDMEFAITQDENGLWSLWLLQLRPLACQAASLSVDQQNSLLGSLYHQLTQDMQPAPFLLGKRTLYGVMPDWNPAEMIGLRPKSLALSLYREVITDTIWAYQRHNYGYRNLRSVPLMRHLYGLPYIDVRVSFNSFLPAQLPESLGSRLVDYYLDRLAHNPNLHDKVEFEIVFSCYAFDIADRLSVLSQHGFNTTEQGKIQQTLWQLTRSIIDPKQGLWQQDAAKIPLLAVRRRQLERHENLDPITHIYWLIEDTKRYGTLPFAGLARAGFIAVELLRSCVSVGALSQARYDAFMANLCTVGSAIMRDRSVLSPAAFLKRYGHLRPGTYDVTSPRYDEDPIRYFGWSTQQIDQDITEELSSLSPLPLTGQDASMSHGHDGEKWQWTDEERLLLTQQLDHHALGVNLNEFTHFIRHAIEGREWAKFHFTQNISDCLRLIARYGQAHGYDVEDIAHADIHVWLDAMVGVGDSKQQLAASIEQGKARYATSCQLHLPPLLHDAKMVFFCQWPDVEPNFITQGRVIAPVISHHQRDQLAGAIVCIPSADPGFDWLFSYPIAGFITAWGGANSHMAIRAAELKLPAVIGAGHVLYERWSQADRLVIDCALKRVEVVY